MDAETLEKIGKLPDHVAIIMDGNRRWARKNGLPVAAGHAAGAEAFRQIAYYCRDIGLKYLTVYAFSTENWKRDREEVDEIMSLLEDSIGELVRDMDKNKVRFNFLGNISALSPELQELCREAKERSVSYKGIQVNFCINYGSRDEILRAVRKFSYDCINGLRTPESLDEKSFSDLLYTSGMPDPDILIRPGGEQRISNFLLWQCAYTEFYYTDVLWPDFNEAELDKALIAYAKRCRRYGGA